MSVCLFIFFRQCPHEKKKKDRGKKCVDQFQEQDGNRMDSSNFHGRDRLVPTQPTLFFFLVNPLFISFLEGWKQNSVKQQNPREMP